MYVKIFEKYVAMELMFHNTVKSVIKIRLIHRKKGKLSECNV